MTKRVRKTNKSPEDQQEPGRLPRARTRNMKTQGSLQESGDLQESKKTAKSQEPRSPRVWRTGTHQESEPKRMTPPYSLQQEEEIERERERKDGETQ